MKALTLWQPWATLVALGVKTVETRSWGTTYRGPVLIHAGTHRPAVGWPPDVASWVASHHRLRYPDRVDEGYHLQHVGDGEALHPLPLGAVVAAAVLADCVPMVQGDGSTTPAERALVLTPSGGLCLADPAARAWNWERIDSQRPYGDFQPGRWAWLFSEVRALPLPVPARGRQGLWNPSPELVQQVLAA